MVDDTGPSTSGRALAPDRRRLLAWYSPRGDAYPWRTASPDPYGVLVSEVMLQQTQAPRVAPIFEAFLTRFPDLRALASASPADVIRAWEGLGYHRRAVALHSAARAIVERYGGRVPREADALRSLPGVGPYTASAIASIAYGEPVAAVDTNARRIAARYLFGAEPYEVATSELAPAAAGWVHRARPGDWNQALMDLGREVCRPRPRCDVCPFRGCRFRASGRVGRPSSRRQPAFEGSLRQVRGRILAELRDRSAVDAVSLVRDLGVPRARIDAAVDGLVRDGLAVRTGEGLRLVA